MQSSETRGGYSAFFSSGYRAIRGAGQSPTSKFTHPFPESPSGSRTLRSPPDDSRKRRNSVIRLFDKMGSNISDVQSLKEKHRRSFVEFDIWTKVSTGFHRPTSRHSCVEKLPMKQQTFDPFSSSPDSKSFFIELADSPIHIRSPAPKTSRVSVMRERPASAHRLPSDRPRCYSVPSCLSKMEMDLELPPPEEWSDPGELDWRQFHIELLDEPELALWFTSSTGLL